MISLAGPPSRWVCRHGLPSQVAEELGWMPSYEHESGKGLIVLDNLILWVESNGQARFLPQSYGTWSIVSPDGPVPLHHSPDAEWVYRPIIYRMTAWGFPQALGSQQELMWRKMLSDSMHFVHAGVGLPDYERANARAREILLDHLSPQQRLEFVSQGKFRVRGGKTKNIYGIEPSNGFRLLSKTTNQEMVSYCLHPEEFIPHDDVALAVKLWLEDAETELEALEGARQYVLGGIRVSVSGDRFAERLERDLIP